MANKPDGELTVTAADLLHLSTKLTKVYPLWSAAIDYQDACRDVGAAQKAHDAAYELQAKDQTYGNVQAWQDAIRVHRVSAQIRSAALERLVLAALQTPGL